MAASGGTETTDGNFKVHTFTSPGTFTVNCVSGAAANNIVSYLVVAGGGGAGSDYGGGGGAAGVGGGAGAGDARGNSSVMEMHAIVGWLQLAGFAVPAAPTGREAFKTSVRAHLNVIQWRAKCVALTAMDAAAAGNLWTRAEAVDHLWTHCPFC